MQDFSIGCNGRGIRHVDPVPLEEQFRMLRDSGVFDHFDRMPQPGEEAEYLRLAHKYGMPIRTGLWSYTAGRDEDRLEHNLRLCKEAGGEFHNIMLYTRNAQGAVVSDQEIVAFYSHAWNLGQKIGIEIGMEVHIYMWSEDLRRVTPVAKQVRAAGLPFNFVLDHSHALLKLDNPEEQDVVGLRAEVESGRFVIDPYEPGNVLDEWIGQNMVHWLQIRPVSPDGPRNVWEVKEGGHYGRACQYPFKRPQPGEWHSPWVAWRVEPCKEVVRRMLRHHYSTPGSPLRYITTDMIDMPDYGGGARYSLFEQNVAIAHWFRQTAAQIQQEVSASESAPSSSSTPNPTRP
jgi:hypothetical protein